MKNFLKTIGNAFLDGLALGLLLGSFLFVAIMFFGCAAVAPGSDPLVVNVERIETIARQSFKSILLIDNQNRTYFATNAPGFHDFCSWLREPTEYANSAGLPADVQMVPRDLAMLLSLDDIKLAYKAGSATSNTLYTAEVTIQALIDKGTALVNGLTNSASK